MSFARFETVVSKFEKDVCLVKKFGDDKYKLTIHKSLRRSGYEEPETIENDLDDYDKTNIVCDKTKLLESISRAKSRIYEYAYCNYWDYFATFTINPEKFNSFDLENYHKKFSQFIRNLNKNKGLNIKYLTIPERHKKGGWHEHGFIRGLPINFLREFSKNEKLPLHILSSLKNGEKVYEFELYRDKFGFCNFEKIRNREHVSRYVTKYISKTLATNISEINAHLYYCSKGLNRAELIKKGSLGAITETPNFENDFVKVYWIDNTNINTILNQVN